MLASRLLIAFVTAATVVGLSQSTVTSQDKKGELRKGSVTGVLVGKKDNFVEIKADGEEKARKYFAPPKNEDVQRGVKGAEIGNRVQADWVFGGEAYVITKFEVLKKGGSDKKDEPKKDEERKGTITGVVTAKGENWIEVKADGEEKARRYVPHWRGGAPAAGGGPDKEMLAEIKKIDVNSRVKLEWVFEERPRVERIEVLKKPTPDKK